MLGMVGCTGMIIHHITLATGDSVAHRLDLVSPEAIQACRALLPAGGPIPSLPAFRVDIAELTVFTIWRGREPIVTCGIGRGRSPTWTVLAKLQARFAPVIAPPPSGQWLGVVVLPGLANQARSDLSWLADFERSLAAAILLPPPNV